MKWKIWQTFRKGVPLTARVGEPLVSEPRKAGEPQTPYRPPGKQVMQRAVGAEPEIVLDGMPAEPYAIPADARDAAVAQEAINSLYQTLDRQQRTQFSRVLEAVVAAQERRRTGAGMIAQERLRQMYEEEWDAEHDDTHEQGELTSAALAYLAFVDGSPAEARSLWPFEMRFWKPSDEDPVRNLVKAGALIAAEIDRLFRQKGSNE